MFAKILYLSLPFALGIGLAIASFQILNSKAITIRWIKYSVLITLVVFSLIFFVIPAWHRRAEIVYPNGVKLMEDQIITLKLVHKSAPLLGVLFGAAFYRMR